MSLFSALNKNGVRRLRVHVSEIERNELNHYNLDGIEEIAANIQEVGQLENATVYELSSEEKQHRNGIKYRLLGGERRWRAISLNHEQGLSDGIIEVVVHPKPEDIWQEQRLIRSDNIQREKTPEDRLREVKLAEEEYNYLISINQRPEGLKQDWIGKQVGLSGRRAADWLNLRKNSLSTEDIVNAGISVQPEAAKPSVNNSSVSNKDEKKYLVDANKLLKNARNTLDKARKIAEDSGEQNAFKFYQDLNKVYSEVLELQEKWKDKF